MSIQTPVAAVQERVHAPFPWYGGKARAAQLIWERLGNVGNYVEPFAGSLAVLLGRPHAPGIETVNDKDAFISNFWRATCATGDPDAVAYWCDQPADESMLHAVHSWLVNQREEFTARLMGDPDYYDAKVAGRWCWGLCCWIGSGWCSGQGPWQSLDGQLLHLGNAGRGIHRQLLHLGDAGQGVHRKRLHLGDAVRGIHRQRLHLGDAGRGIHRQLLHLGTAGQAENGLVAWLRTLAVRLRRVRVCCGDWTRVLGPSVTWKHGLTGVVLDCPYQSEEREDVYSVDTPQIAEDVREWARVNGENPLLRIALCGYETATYAMPETWQKVCWKANGGYGNQRTQGCNPNKYRETVWFSPACLGPTQPTLFERKNQEAPLVAPGTAHG